MTITLQDTFTGTNGTLLASHNPDIGSVGSWEAMQFGLQSSTPGSNLEISSNSIRSTGSTGTGAAQAPTHRNNTDPGSDEYDISCTISFHVQAQAQRFHWIDFRATTTGNTNSTVNRYQLFGNSGTSQTWELYKIVSGTATLLDSAAAALAGNSFNIRIEVRNGSITVFINDVSTLTTTDVAITQRGRVCVGSSRGGDVSTHWIDSLSVDSIVAGLNLNVGFHQQINSIFLPAITNQVNDNLSVGFVPSGLQIFQASIVGQSADELLISFKSSSSTIFQVLIHNEGDQLFEPILLGNGSLADQIMAGLIDQGFLSGSLADREYLRLLSKLALAYTGAQTIADLYFLANEENRIAGLVLEAV